MPHISAHTSINGLSRFANLGISYYVVAVGVELLAASKVALLRDYDSFFKMFGHILFEMLRFKIFLV